MRLLVGLGNPGPRYAPTRHNVGFLAAEEMARRLGAERWSEVSESLVAECTLGDQRVLVAKPQTFMNRSGKAVAELAKRFGLDPSALVVMHDDLDLPFGRLRVRPGGGHGGHNGLRSILEEIGTGEFARVKIGIGRPRQKEDVVEYVLSPFDADQVPLLGELIERAAAAAECVLREGAVPAMNRFNA